MQLSLARFLCFFLVLFSFTTVEGYARDAASFNPIPIQLVAQGAGGVPVGTVVAWPVATNPSDAASWLECNGQSTVGYPELAAVVGPNVPDYQGLFLRGHGSQNHIKSNGSDIGSTVTTHISGGLKTIQGDTIRNITGDSGHLYLSQYAGDIGFGALRQEPVYGGKGNDHNWGLYMPKITLDVSRVVPTANENRPVNTAVRYLIRARP